MADNNSVTMNSNKPNQTIKAEQAKAEMSGQHHEKAQTDKERQEPSAIGSGKSSSQPQTGEQGRVRDEIGSSHPADKPEALKNDSEAVTPR